MRAPISLRIKDGTTDLHVTRYAERFRFRKTAPGGHADASCTLNLPSGTFPDLGPTDRIWAYDNRTARPLWEGYINNPGIQTGRDGQSFEIAALGGLSLASDRRERLIYIDQSYDFTQDTTYPQVASSTAQVGIFPEAAGGALPGQPCALVQFNPGQPITTGSQVGLSYSKFQGSPMVLGGFAGVYDMGRTDGNFLANWYGDVGVLNLIDTVSMTNVAGPIIKNRETHFAGKVYTYLGFRLTRVAGGPTNIATDDFWAGYGDFYIFGLLLDRYRVARAMDPLMHASGSTPAPYILAHDVAEDLLGRILTFCDPTTSLVYLTGTGQIDQLAYADAVAATTVLDDLLLTESGYLWEFLESNAAGKHRFNWRPWPTTPRYLIPSSLHVEQPGGETDLCNRIAVNWVDPLGVPRVMIRGIYVPELGDRSPVLWDGTVDPAFVGRIRDADPITLPAGIGSLWNAAQIGDQVLAAKATTPRAAKVTVDRPIVDTLRNVDVWPWELEPGYVARIMSTGDNLRVTEMEYDDDAGASTLTLSDPVLSVDQRVARLERVR